MPRIDEQERRRPEFVGDVPVTLCDGGTWFLPKPRICLAPKRNATGFETRCAVMGWGHDYYSKLDALEVAGLKDDSVAAINAEMDLACALLLRNYDLTDDELAEVLWFDMQDEANGAMRRRIMETAQGFAPKPDGDGSSGT